MYKAYIDPATTTYVIQIVAAVVISCGVAIGVFRKRIQMLFLKIKMHFVKKSIEKKSSDNTQ